MVEHWASNGVVSGTIAAATTVRFLPSRFPVLGMTVPMTTDRMGRLMNRDGKNEAAPYEAKYGSGDRNRTAAFLNQNRLNTIPN